MAQSEEAEPEDKSDALEKIMDALIELLPSPQGLCDFILDYPKVYISIHLALFIIGIILTIIICAKGVKWDYKDGSFEFGPNVPQNKLNQYADELKEKIIKTSEDKE